MPGSRRSLCAVLEHQRDCLSQSVVPRLSDRLHFADVDAAAMCNCQSQRTWHSTEMARNNSRVSKCRNREACEWASPHA